MRGKFIVFEGLDGSGSSTQTALLADYLRLSGKRVVVTKEPTNNIIGGLIRGQLSSDWKSSPDCLQLLFAADRMHHLEKEVLPALEKGNIVICDRYVLSSLAFGGLDCNLHWLKKLNEKFLVPHLTILLKVSPAACIARVKAARFSLELFEDEKKMSSVWQNYEQLAKDYPNVHIIDGEKSEKDVLKEIIKKLETLN
jgi:dTMP kinase